MFDHIAIFISLVDYGGFTLCAENLRLSQATISRKIYELETYLGTTLLIRDTRNIRLSEAGIIIYNRYKNMNQDFQDAINELNPQKVFNVTKNKVTLRVCLNGNISYELICPYFNYYTKQYPHVRLDLVFANFIGDMEFDIGISHIDFTRDGYNSKLIRNDCMKFYCTPQYANTHGLPRTIDELQNHDIIGGIDYSVNNVIEPIDRIILINKYTKEKHVFLDNGSNIRTHSTIYSKKIGMSANKIFWCIESICEQEVVQGKLIQVLPEFHIFRGNSFYLIYKDNLSHEATRFCDFLYKCMEKSLRINTSIEVIDKSN